MAFSSHFFPPPWLIIPIFRDIKRGSTGIYDMKSDSYGQIRN